ncbi:MAG TPA: hypothetical protein P5567_15595 [Kiritimatiellia bacterium]|nr:hypothetical protein [Kiritimatiellia bacterium]HRZ13867.1 hypothetical protein [Kiritimatiellia bacterium]
MNRILTLTAVLLVIVACFAFATDPESSFREGVRTQVMSNIYSVAVSFPGNVTITSNATVAGNAAITGNQIVGGTTTAAVLKVLGAATVDGAATLTGGIAGGTTVTQVWYSVPQSTASCVTNRLIIYKGVGQTLTQAP